MLNKIDAEEVHHWTVKERCKLCPGFGNRSASEVNSTIKPTNHWHRIDRPMTQRQRNMLPEDAPFETRSAPIWVKFRHPERLQNIVVSRGYHDFDTGTWAARLRPGEGVSHFGSVTPEEWALIICGEPPPEWVGAMIQKGCDA